MSPHLLVWVAALILQSGLLGRAMFTVGLGKHHARRASRLRVPSLCAPSSCACRTPLCAARLRPACPLAERAYADPHAAQIMSLSDLENDFLNPFDACSRLNRFVVGAHAQPVQLEPAPPAAHPAAATCPSWWRPPATAL